MNLSRTRVLSHKQIFELIEEGKNAELCRDAKATIRILKPVWEDIEIDPEFDERFEPEVRAQLLRLAGFLLSYLGKTKIRKGYQERGADLLTRAMVIFEELGLPDKVAEARVTLALCYWYSNRHEESQTILSETELEYGNNWLHPVYLQSCISQLMSLYPNEEYTKAFDIIERIKIPMEFCKDNRLQAMFHNQAGIIFYFNDKFDQAFYHFESAVRFAEIIKSPTFIAANINNIANVYQGLRKYKESLEYCDKAEKIYVDREEGGWIAEVCDTRANTSLLQKRISFAFDEINRAIEIAQTGDDYIALARYYFTRFNIQIADGDLFNALLDYATIIEICKAHLSEKALFGYTKKCTGLLYGKKGLNYENETREFQKHLIVESLKVEGCQVSKTALRLGMKSHQYLSDRLDKEFPEVYEELGFERRKRSSLSAKLGKSKKADSLIVRKVEQIKVQSENIVFEGISDEDKKDLRCFILDGSRIPLIRADGGVIVLCRKVVADKDFISAIVEIADDQQKIAGTIFRDFLSGVVFFQEFHTDKEYLPAEFNILGEIIGYCLLDKFDGERIIFEVF